MTRIARVVDPVKLRRTKPGPAASQRERDIHMGDRVIDKKHQRDHACGRWRHFQQDACERIEKQRLEHEFEPVVPVGQRYVVSFLAVMQLVHRPHPRHSVLNPMK